MGIIRDNIRSKKLYKSGNVTSAYRDSAGDIVVPAVIAQELNNIGDITESINDPGIFHVNKHLIKQLEEMRLDIEELHTFIKDAFGKDSTQAASKGDIGLTGLTGLTGPKGDDGELGPKGDNGLQGEPGTSSGSSYPQFTTALDTEIQVGTVVVTVDAVEPLKLTPNPKESYLDFYNRCVKLNSYSAEECNLWWEEYEVVKKSFMNNCIDVEGHKASECELLWDNRKLDEPDVAATETKDLFYIRYEVDIARESGGSILVKPFIQGVIKSNIIINATEKGMSFPVTSFFRDPSAAAMIILDDNKGMIGLNIRSDEPFTASYNVIFELWYTKGAPVEEAPSLTTGLLPQGTYELWEGTLEGEEYHWNKPKEQPFLNTSINTLDGDQTEVTVHDKLTGIYTKIEYIPKESGFRYSIGNAVNPPGGTPYVQYTTTHKIARQNFVSDADWVISASDHNIRIKITNPLK